MTMSIPESVPAEGNVKAIFVPTLGSDSAALINAGTDISSYLMPDWDGPTPTQNTGETRRFSSKEAYKRLGRKTWDIAQLMYTYLPQAATSVAGNKVYTALAEGNKGFLVVGYGIDPSVAFKSTDKVDIFPVECGVQAKGARGADEFAPLTITQTLVVSNAPRRDVALIA